ncbi:hypothetical protein CBR_g2972 [Chara braunii]|uniref:protein-serine/threonine phosphatase n=1 Tax=Chara braunii TaxID=69332 RepID=A0A388KEE7_CHABU|nr:hypothetical protein CBR_g2972 [Chara braunii]|eukprot:GBG68428.1 hypothetical protein CBR_g2972 [Chara braunii]
MLILRARVYKRSCLLIFVSAALLHLACGSNGRKHCKTTPKALLQSGVSIHGGTGVWVRDDQTEVVSTFSGQRESQMDPGRHQASGGCKLRPTRSLQLSCDDLAMPGGSTAREMFFSDAAKSSADDMATLTSNRSSICRMALLKGRRMSMEDRAICVDELQMPGKLPSVHFFAVYDGHGGAEAAETVVRRLHHVFRQRVVQRVLQQFQLGRASGLPKSEAIRQTMGSDRTSKFWSIAERMGLEGRQHRCNLEEHGPGCDLAQDFVGDGLSEAGFRGGLAAEADQGPDSGVSQSGPSKVGRPKWDCLHETKKKGSVEGEESLAEGGKLLLGPCTDPTRGFCDMEGLGGGIPADGTGGWQGSTDGGLCVDKNALDCENKDGTETGDGMERGELQTVGERLLLDVRDLADGGAMYRNLLSEALREAILDVDDEFSRAAETQRLASGTTATIALVVDGWLLVSNLGDTQGTLCREGQNEGAPSMIDSILHRQLRMNRRLRSRKRRHPRDKDADLCSAGELRAVDLTSDHRPDREDERQRIKAMGGTVTLYDDVWRVQGSLAVTRSIGDVRYKRYGVIADPEMNEWYNISSEDAFLVIASDGVFEHLNSQDACNIICAVRRGLGWKAVVDEAVSVSPTPIALSGQSSTSNNSLNPSEGSRDDSVKIEATIEHSGDVEAGHADAIACRSTENPGRSCTSELSNGKSSLAVGRASLRSGDVDGDSVVPKSSLSLGTNPRYKTDNKLRDGAIVETATRSSNGPCCQQPCARLSNWNRCCSSCKPQTHGTKPVALCRTLSSYQVAEDATPCNRAAIHRTNNDRTQCCEIAEHGTKPVTPWHTFSSYQVAEDATPCNGGAKHRKNDEGTQCFEMMEQPGGRSRPNMETAWTFRDLGEDTTGALTMDMSRGGMGEVVMDAQVLDLGPESDAIPKETANGGFVGDLFPVVFDGGTRKDDQVHDMNIMRHMSSCSGDHRRDFGHGHTGYHEKEFPSAERWKQASGTPGNDARGMRKESTHNWRTAPSGGALMSTGLTWKSQGVSKEEEEQDGSRKGEVLQRIVDSLVVAAYESGSMDNIAAIVVNLTALKEMHDERDGSEGSRLLGAKALSENPDAVLTWRSLKGGVATYGRSCAKFIRPSSLDSEVSKGREKTRDDGQVGSNNLPREKSWGVVAEVNNHLTEALTVAGGGKMSREEYAAEKEHQQLKGVGPKGGRDGPVKAVQEHGVVKSTAEAIVPGTLVTAESSKHIYQLIERIGKKKVAPSGQSVKSIATHVRGLESSGGIARWRTVRGSPPQKMLAGSVSETADGTPHKEGLIKLYEEHLICSGEYFASPPVDKICSLPEGFHMFINLITSVPLQQHPFTTVVFDDDGVYNEYKSSPGSEGIRHFSVHGHGRYILKENFARGAFGEVWLAVCRERSSESEGMSGQKRQTSKHSAGEDAHHDREQLCQGEKTYVLKRIMVEKGEDVRLSGLREKHFGELFQNATMVMLRKSRVTTATVRMNQQPDSKGGKGRIQVVLGVDGRHDRSHSFDSNQVRKNQANRDEIRMDAYGDLDNEALGFGGSCMMQPKKGKVEAQFPRELKMSFQKRSRRRTVKVAPGNWKSSDGDKTDDLRGRAHLGQGMWALQHIRQCQRELTLGALKVEACDSCKLMSLDAFEAQQWCGDSAEDTDGCGLHYYDASKPHAMRGWDVQIAGDGRLMRSAGKIMEKKADEMFPFLEHGQLGQVWTLGGQSSRSSLPPSRIVAFGKDAAAYEQDSENTLPYNDGDDADDADDDGNGDGSKHRTNAEVLREDEEEFRLYKRGGVDKRQSQSQFDGLENIARYVESFEVNKGRELWLVFANEGKSLSKLLYTSKEGGKQEEGNNNNQANADEGGREKEKSTEESYTQEQQDDAFRASEVKASYKLVEPSAWWRWLKTDPAGHLEMKSIIRQLLLAVKACHSLNVTHRDIKPENMLIRGYQEVHSNMEEQDGSSADSQTEEAACDGGSTLPHNRTDDVGSGDRDQDAERDRKNAAVVDLKLNITVRIADFGSAVDEYSLRHLYGSAGPSRVQETAEYSPPEALFGNYWLQSKRERRPKYDIWSVGVVVLELLLGTPHVFHISSRTRALLDQRLGVWDEAAKEMAYLLRAFLELCILSPVKVHGDESYFVSPTSNLSSPTNSTAFPPNRTTSHYSCNSCCI